jgi:protein N-lysine methyltransferase METTL21A
MGFLPAEDLSDDYDSDLEILDPFRNIRAEKIGRERDFGSELLSVLPGQHYSIQGNAVSLTFTDTGSNKDQEPIHVNILADAAPGCGGIVWPAGQVAITHL